MKESSREDYYTVLKGGRQDSFFKIDPENWPDLPTPATKIKRQRIRIITPKRLLTCNLPPPDAPWQIPKSTFNPAQPGSWLRAALQALEKADKLQENRKQEEEEEKKFEIRSEGIHLIRKIESGQITHDDALKFYKDHAEDLIPYREYQRYLFYQEKNGNGSDPLPWPAYAREAILEIFVADLIHLVPLISQTTLPKLV